MNFKPVLINHRRSGSADPTTGSSQTFSQQVDRFYDRRPPLSFSAVVIRSIMITRGLSHTVKNRPTYWKGVRETDRQRLIEAEEAYSRIIKDA